MKTILKLSLLLSLASVTFASCHKATESVPEKESNAAGSKNAPTTVSAFNGTFVHPGITLNKANLDKIKATATTEPRASGYAKLAASPLANVDTYVHHARATVNCDGNTSGDFTTDGDAVFTMALRYYKTGDLKYARKCISIMNAWSLALRVIQPGDGEYELQDRLVTGWAGAHYAEAAEIIRYTTPAGTWPTAEVDRYKKMLNDIFWPQVSQPAPGCPSSSSPGCQFDPNAPRASNHEASYAKTQLAIAVFLGDANKFNAGLTRARSIIDKYIDPSTGECNEACRINNGVPGDAGHSQMGIGELSLAAEIAWKQNEDLYAHLNSRLALGIEYLAKLKNNVTMPSHCGQLRDDNPSNLFPMWEVGYNHYHNRKQRSMPYTLTTVNRTRASDRAGTTKIGAFAWQTFTHAELY